MAIPNHGPRLKPNDAGIFEIRWCVAGRSYTKSTRRRDIESAQIVLAEFLRKERSEKIKVLTLGRCLDDYLSEHADERTADPVRQEIAAANLKKGLGVATLVKDLDSQAINLYKRKRKAGEVNGRKVGDGTLRRELNMLVAAVNHAKKNKRIDGRDLPYIPLPPEPPPKDLWLTEQEQDTFLDYARQHAPRALYWFIVIALGTASRRKAIERLAWEQIDMDARLIHFRPNGSRQTKKKRVPVPMPSLVFDLLATVPQDNRVGPVLNTTKDQYRDFVDLCDAAAIACGIEKFADVTPHTLRHTWATLAARRGVAMDKIAGILGDTLATVTKVYLHHSPDYLRGAVE